MANGWRVTGQRGTQDIQNGRLVAAMEVNVVTDDGTEKTFMVPEGSYTPESVAAIVDAWYERQQAVANL